MKKSRFITLFTAACLLSGCSQNGASHFITDRSIREKVEADFNARKKAVNNDALFAIDETATEEELEAMRFLLAYMPVGDITDYGTPYFLEQVRQTLKMRDQVKWKDSIPESIFRHYVLPVRTNNETLDNFRGAYGPEIYERVKDMNLKDAALAVNHWCHEKVVYTSTDGRTFGPEAAMRNAGGRCGEESVFAVAAMRSVGIPARQVYSPRWAHTDDNHAWVEVYVEDKWQFLGACEPEPVLNLGWFNGPASRGMLMLTNAFGASYDGPEEVTTQTPNYTEVNVMYTYGPTAKADFIVKDAAGAPVEDATLEFKIYNYGEFNTVVRKKSDKQGHAFLNAGLGDMFVWASKDGAFGYSKVSFGKDGEVVITLDKKFGDPVSVEMDLIPPVEGAVLPDVTDEMRAENNRKLAQEDSVRNNYTATFCTEEQAKALAKELNTDEALTVKYMTMSRGNHAEIETFLRETAQADRALALSLLGTVSAKDTRDVPASVFTAHLSESLNRENPLFIQYILNPRIDREFLTAYKGVLQKETDADFAKSAVENPQLLVEWTKNNVRVDNSLNYQKLAMQPLGVWKARVCDDRSLNRFFVAYARALGIPARIEPVACKVQYFANNNWIDVDFAGEGTPKAASQGELKISYKPTQAVKDPGYYKHFTIAKLDGDKLQTLDFETNSNVDMGGGSNLSNLMKKPMKLDEGEYLLVTGSRQGDGSVLSKVESFRIEAGKRTDIEMVLREDAGQLKVVGNIDGTQTFSPLNACMPLNLKTAAQNEAYVVAILGVKQEPTNHSMRDFAEFSKEFEQWGGKMVLLFPSEEDHKRFDEKEFKGLPQTIQYGIDSDKNVTKALMEATGLTNASLLPIVAIVNKKGEIVFVSQGYTIGLGAQMLKVVHKL